MSLFRSNTFHPGWPGPVGPLRVKAGVVRLRPVRLRDAAVWSRIRLADQTHLEPWEPVSGVDWRVRHAVSSWPAICSGLRGEARRGRMLPYVIELDGQFAGQLTIGNVTHGALRSAWIGYWVASDKTGGGVATGALALGLDHCFNGVQLHRVEATVRPENAREPGRAGAGRLPRGGPAAPLSRGGRRLAGPPPGRRSRWRSSSIRRPRPWSSAGRASLVLISVGT